MEMTGSVKTLGEFETVRIKFEGREEYLEISGNGELRYDLINQGGTENIFQISNDSNKEGQTGYYAQNSQSRYDAFDRQQSYISTLCQVQSIEHNVHEELTEAIEKLKELTYT